MPGLDSDTLQMVLATLQKYADKKLPEKLLLELDHNDEFPRKVLKELYDTRNLGLHLYSYPSRSAVWAAEHTTSTAFQKPWPRSTWA